MPLTCDPVTLVVSEQLLSVSAASDHATSIDALPSVTSTEMMRAVPSAVTTSAVVELCVEKEDEL